MSSLAAAPNSSRPPARGYVARAKVVRMLDSQCERARFGRTHSPAAHRPTCTPSRPMRSSRRIALTAAAIVIALVGTVMLLAFLSRDRIASRLKAELNGSLNAKVDWSDVSLGLFRDFPNVTLSLEDLSIVGVKPFAGDTLAAARTARLVLDLGSVVGYLRNGDRIVIRELSFGEPDVRLLVLPDGTANWNITREQAATEADTGGAVGITLRNLRVTDGRLTLDNRKSQLDASLVGLDWSLDGDFGKDRFVLGTRTRADTVSLRFAGVPYLTRVGVEFNSDIDADLPANRFTFRDDTLRLNALVLAFTGSWTTSEPLGALDLTFSTPSTAFREILSLVPAVYARDFGDVQTSGTMAVSGQVRGNYGPGAFPALSIRARVDNGAFKYKALPLPARDVSLDLAIDNPGGDVDRTVIDLKRLHAAIGGRPLDATLVMRTPVSDPDVDVSVKGSLNLADLGRTVKLEGVSELAGSLAADVAMRARMSDMDAGRYDRVAARGTVNVARLSLKSSAIPHAVSVDTGALRLTPRTAELTSLVAKVGSSDVRARGSIDNVLAFALRNEELRGSATLSSGHFDLNEWKSDDETTEVIPVPPRVDFRLDASAARVTYGKVTAANVRGALRIKDERVTLDELRMETLRGTLVANGFYETTVADKPTFDVDLRLAAVDIPTAFTTLATVQKLAPIARWAQGTMSGSVGLKGTLGQDMTPVFSALTGKGDIQTERLVIEGAPILEKLASALSLQQLDDPALDALRATFEIIDGRLHVQPFVVRFAGIDMRVAGSNGIDQSLSYDIGLAVPRASLGAAANQAVARLAAQAGKAGIDLTAGEVVQLGAKVTGTVTDPSVRANFVGMAGSAREAVQDLARQQVETRAEAVRQTVDSAAEAARARARAEADRVVAEAERQAATIRTEARELAETVRREGKERADSLLARATNPAAKMAAQVATDRLRREADERAERLVREADVRADELVARAKQRADALAPPET